MRAHFAVASVLTGLVGGALPAQAQTPPDYSGNQITIMIGYGVGGTYYRYAKLFADHLGRFIPGNPTIIVQSLPGAGGLKLLNMAAQIMPSDGTHIFVPPDTMVISQLTGKENIHFDARRFHYIGTGNQQNNFWVVKRSAANSLDDLKAREVVSGHSGKGSTGYLVPSLARETLDLKVRLIAGYKGSRDTILAMERGEIDAASFGWETWAQAVPHWFKGDASIAVPLLQLGDKPDPDMPQVPLLRSMVKKEDVPLVNLFDTIGIIGRSLAFPPGVKREQVDAMRRAFEAMLKDRAFRDDAAKQRLRLATLSGTDLTTAINQAIDSAEPALLARARAMVAR